jgi:hypothetical protein
MFFIFLLAVAIVGVSNGIVLLEWFNASAPSTMRRTRIVFPGSGKTYRLPWPMTLHEALKFINILGIVITGTLILAIELGFWLFEPSPWRFAPALVSLAALKLLIPSVLKKLAVRKRDAETGEVDSGE